MRGRVDVVKPAVDFSPVSVPLGAPCSVCSVSGIDNKGTFGIVARTPSLTLTGDIALYNRSEILERLGGIQGADESSCDGCLILAAYRKWAESCPQYLLGEFTFAIWDDRRRSLFCCTDHMGARPFLYCLSGSTLAFASNLQEILNSPGVRRQANLRKLAAFGQGLYPEETFHAGINSLPPGSWMALSGEGLRKGTYWHPEIREDLLPAHDEEVFEGLRELLEKAVVDRIAGSRNVAAHLSGGLDSSSVVSIAGRHLASRNRGLTALSVVVPDDMRSYVSDERDFIEEFLGYPGVRIRYVTAQGRGPFDSLEDLARFEASFLLTSRFYLYEALEDAAVETGADVLLHGLGGEYGPTSWGAGYLSELALRGHWFTLMREMKALRHVSGVSPLRMLAGEFLSSALPRRHSQPLLLLNRNFIRSAGNSRKQIAKSRWPNQRRDQPAMFDSWLRSHALRPGGLGDKDRVRVSNPFLDKRVIEFCLAVPCRFKVRNGYQRYLIRKALDGILPPRVQWRTSKTPFSPDYYFRYNNQLRKARDFVGGIAAHDPVRAIVDVEALNRLLKPVPVPHGNFAALGTVPTTIYLIAFLRQFPEFRL